MKQRARFLIARIDERTPRERMIGFLIVLLGLYLAWDTLLFQPLETERERLEKQATTLRREVGQLNARVGDVALRRTADPDAPVRERVRQLRAELERIDAGLVAATGQLVPPRDMARLLEALLNRESGLRLVKLEGLGVEPVLKLGGGSAHTDAATDGARSGAKKDGPAKQTAGLGLFRHGLRVEFEGGFMETLQYLAALESLSWRFLWENVDYEVRGYPVARVSITVYSLSLDENWIGV